MKSKTKGLIAAFMLLGMIFIVVIAVYAVGNDDNENMLNESPEESDAPSQIPQTTEPTISELPEETLQPAATDDPVTVTDQSEIETPDPSETASPTHTDNAVESSEPEIDEEKLAKSRESLDGILTYFKDNFQGSGFDEYLINDIPAQGYPEYYGGAYINASGDLVVLLMDGSEEVKSHILEIGENDNILFDEADFSYRHLVETMEEIENYIETGKSDGFTITSMDIDDFGNRVIVDISDVSEETIALFKSNVSDSESVLFIRTINVIENY